MRSGKPPTTTNTTSLASSPLNGQTMSLANYFTPTTTISNSQPANLLPMNTRYSSVGNSANPSIIGDSDSGSAQQLNNATIYAPYFNKSSCKRDSDNHPNCVYDYSLLSDEERASIVNISAEYPAEIATVLFGYIAPFVLLITIVGNSMVILVLAQRHMRTPTNIVLFAMAIVDPMTPLSPSPWFFYTYTLGDHNSDSFLYPPSACYLHHIMNDTLPIFFHTISIWLALLLATQRYIYVCHPALASTWCTVNRVRKAVLFIVLLAFLHQFSRAFDLTFGPIRLYHDERDQLACRKDYREWASLTYHTFYYGFRILFVHVMPCTALITLNYLLFKALRQAESKRSELFKFKLNYIYKTTPTLATTNAPMDTNNDNYNQPAGQQQHEIQRLNSIANNSQNSTTLLVQDVSSTARTTADPNSNNDINNSTNNNNHRCNHHQNSYDNLNPMRHYSGQTYPGRLSIVSPISNIELNMLSGNIELAGSDDGLNPSSLVADDSEDDEHNCFSTDHQPGAGPNCSGHYDGSGAGAGAVSDCRDELSDLGLSNRSLFDTSGLAPPLGNDSCSGTTSCEAHPHLEALSNTETISLNHIGQSQCKRQHNTKQIQFSQDDDYHNYQLQHNVTKLKTKKKNKKRKKGKTSIESNNSNDSNNQHHLQCKLTSRASSMAQPPKTIDSNRTTMMLIVVVTVFLINELPVAVATIIHCVWSLCYSFGIDFDLRHETWNYMKTWSNFLMMLSHPVNFSIYCSMSKKFRETFRDLFLDGNLRNKRDTSASRCSVVPYPKATVSHHGCEL